MKRTFASLPVVILMLLVTPLFVVGQPSPQSSHEQCKLAVLSHGTVSKESGCSSEDVRQLASSGHVFEQNEMGMASMLVIGPEYSEKEALTWFERAAQHEYAPAQVNLAVMYMNGWGVPANYAAALHWLYAAAGQGFPRAYFNLGILFLNGQGVRQDYAEAFRWFQKGADANDADAEANLGWLYDQGLGCPHNAATAVAWYRKAAAAGNALGENNLADMYLRGEGVRQDYSEAFRLFQKAAVEGLTSARIKLGYMYANGLGVKKDSETAYAWVLAASTAGDHRGDYLLPALKEVFSARQIAIVGEKSQSAPFKPVKQAPVNSFVP